jgi:protein translocase SecG subunit
MKLAIQIAQITLSILLMTLVLIQSKGIGLSGAFGGGGEVFYTRRGAEKIIFIMTIVVIILFTITSLLNVWMS